ncbi:MAG: VTT domain-containing protein [Candidatus Nomurabacteria bacterium]|jgi:uncharacterized membrane protein YdjX (TVP38/TMEM64 family)|nr:VTT domain-containing protein [Candidatus Nomurabacteria bacterium]
MKITTRIKNAVTPQAIVVLVLLILALGAVAYFFGADIVNFFANPEQIKEAVRSAGPLGPILYIFLQFLQVVFAPIPASVTGAVGGALFGWWGLIFTVGGVTLGTMALVALVRKFGRPFLERLFGKAQIAKFDFIIDHKGAPLILFLIFLFPFFPDDFVGALAGLTKIRFRDIILLSLIGRLPMQAITNFFGNEFLDGNLLAIIIMCAVLGLMSIVIYRKRKWLESFMHADDHIEFLKNSFKKRK